MSKGLETLERFIPKDWDRDEEDIKAINIIKNELLKPKLEEFEIWLERRINQTICNSTKYACEGCEKEYECKTKEIINRYKKEVLKK